MGSYNASAKFTEVYSMPIKSSPDLRIAHLGYDRSTRQPKTSTLTFLSSGSRKRRPRSNGELNSRFYGYLRFIASALPPNATPRKFSTCAARMV
jgi:hypothetical protein